MAPCYVIDFTVGWSFGEPHPNSEVNNVPNGGSVIVAVEVGEGLGVVEDHGVEVEGPARELISRMTARWSRSGSEAILGTMRRSTALEVS